MLNPKSRIAAREVLARESRSLLAPELEGEALKREFRRLAKEHHPDSGGNPETFRALLEEYRARAT